ncbi:unnamed protein product [Owenia fusiformis]|uniref:Uncharacterized protein n=1 Tax=Owenia fusiformis TaxID=6347 RepID=A0A8S4NWT7_OWEFU|nr:unnamed protein product [Owenia fusiformis]
MAYLDEVMNFSNKMLQGIAKSWFIQRNRKITEEEALKREDKEMEMRISEEIELISCNRELLKLQEFHDMRMNELHSLKRTVTDCRKKKRALDKYISVISCRFRHQKQQRGHCNCNICQTGSRVLDLSVYQRGESHFPTIEEMRYIIE